MKKTLDIWNPGDHVDLYLADGGEMQDVSIWAFDHLGLTVSYDEGTTIRFVPWASVDHLDALKKYQRRAEASPAAIRVEVAR